MSRVQSRKSLPKKPNVETEPKRRGRKRKSDLPIEQGNVETGNDLIEPEFVTEPVREESKVTRSGRISKPRPRDLDMVS